MSVNKPPSLSRLAMLSTTEVSATKALGSFQAPAAALRSMYRLVTTHLPAASAPSTVSL